MTVALSAYLGLVSEAGAPSLGLVVETDLAQAVGSQKDKVVLQATEIDLAQAVSGQKAKSILQATEVDLAQALAGSQKVKGVLQVVEADLAQPVHIPTGQSVLQVVETDLAQAVSSQKAKSIIQAVETDLAQAVGSQKAKSIIQATETDLAQVLASSQKAKSIIQVVETNLAQPLDFGTLSLVDRSVSDSRAGTSTAGVEFHLSNGGQLETEGNVDGQFWDDEWWSLLTDPIDDVYEAAWTATVSGSDPSAGASMGTYRSIVGFLVPRWILEVTGGTDTGVWTMRVREVAVPGNFAEADFTVTVTDTT